MGKIHSKTFTEILITFEKRNRPIALSIIAGVKQEKHFCVYAPRTTPQPMIGLGLTSVRVLFELVTSYARGL